MMASPAEISSPSFLSHETTRPSFMVEESAGMVMVDPSAKRAVVVVVENDDRDTVRTVPTEKASFWCTAKAARRVTQAKLSLMMVNYSLVVYSVE